MVWTQFDKLYAMHTCMYVCMNMYYFRTQRCVCMYVYLNESLLHNMCLNVCYVCLYACMYVCMYVYMND